jgi:hypothetical protein
MRQNNEKEILSQIEENVEIFLETNLKQDTTPLVKKISNTFFLLTFRDIIANGLTKVKKKELYWD